MSTVIYYFTGTGNSLAAARKLAGALHADLLPICSAVNQSEITPEAECVGIVFPVYNHRVPYIVKRFAGRLTGLGGKYLFAVGTYGNNPCAALEYLAKQLAARGGSLACGWGVKMPYNYINPAPGLSGLAKPFVLRETSSEEQRLLLAQAQTKLDAIGRAVLCRETGVLETDFAWLEHTVDFLRLRDTLQKRVWLKVAGYKGKTALNQMESVTLMDCGFAINDRCARCGVCAGLCPIGNIRIGPGGPEWRHTCEQCFACLHWCPRGAIEFGAGTVGRKRYHHPEITLADMAASNAREEREWPV